ncbi:hypothetical protein LTR53_005462 [Teratosphaeriaceae sp. CCFEE 6253]|nr:hypothetical protein LTR53_005462 [Teratosphaeriaceae sp. CCFEE 6253]
MPKRRGASASPSASPARRRRTADHDASSEDDDTNGVEADTNNTDNMVAKLVRLALASEYARQPLRRQAIRDKIPGMSGKHFKHVFEQAQVQLEGVFGMRMVELPAAEKVTVAQKRAAKSQSQTQNKTPQAYILINVLPSHLRDPAVIAPPAVPSPGAEAQYIALYTLLISLVSLSGGQLPDTKLERYLRRLDLEDRTPVPGFAKTEMLLKRMMGDGYLVKIKESTGAGGEEDVYWTVGPRGKVEVGEDGVKGITRAVYGEVEDVAELERKMNRSLGVGERVVPRKEGDSLTRKKTRGRKRKDAVEQEDDDEDDDD